MSKKTISVPNEDLWEAVKIKAGPIAISKIVVQLLRMWLIGLVTIDWDIK